MSTITMTPEAAKLLQQDTWRRMGLVKSPPAPAVADRSRALRGKGRLVAGKRTKTAQKSCQWKRGGLMWSWLRLASTVERFDWMDVDEVMAPKQRRAKGLHSSTAHQMMRTGLLRQVIKARQIGQQWTTSIYTGTVAARALWQKLNGGNHDKN